MQEKHISYVYVSEKTLRKYNKGEEQNRKCLPRRIRYPHYKIAHTKKNNAK